MPSSEVPRRIQVGVDLDTASLAFEEGLLRPVVTLGVTTAGAALRRVLRVFLDDLSIDQCHLLPGCGSSAPGAAPAPRGGGQDTPGADRWVAG